MAVQETQGLLSPFLREMRLREVVRSIPNEEPIVLDLACGAGFLATKLPKDCRYYGVDRIEVDRSELSDEGAQSRQFLIKDLTQPGAFDEIAAWLPGPVDVITMAAFIEHVSEPESLVRSLLPLLKENGIIVGTTPHPVGRSLHEILAKVGICSRDGADEHEKFLDASSLEEIATAIEAINLTKCTRFLLGLNQCFVYTREFEDHATHDASSLRDNEPQLA